MEKSCDCLEIPVAGDGVSVWDLAPWLIVRALKGLNGLGTLVQDG
jgi:hypothetical protein